MAEKKLYKVARLVAVTAIVVSASQTIPAWAEKGIHPFIEYSITHDSNVFKLPNEQYASLVRPGNTQMSDNIQRISAGVQAEAKLGQQVFRGNAAVDHTWYSSFKELDYDGKDLSLIWNWRSGSHLLGDIGASYNTTLTPFSSRVGTVGGFDRILLTQKNIYANGIWAFHPSWQARAGYTHTTIGYDSALLDYLDRAENAIELGVDYLPSTTSTVGVQFRHIKGDFSKEQPLGIGKTIDNDYSQNELMAKIDWSATAKTRLQLLGGYVQRSYSNSSQQPQNGVAQDRDFNGLNARIIGTWAPTAKLGLVTSIWRETGIYDSSTASYTLNKGISLAPSWDITSKVRGETLLRYEKRDYVGESQLLNNANRSDNLHYYSMSLQYIPWNKLKMGVSVYRDIRNSSAANAYYKSNGVMFNSRYQF
ncbi:MAG: XrtB/PEP-CTERM-associated polysaccharide biosynthesis outer membrane protein EpsL [Pseudomonadota bacterium]